MDSQLYNDPLLAQFYDAASQLNRPDFEFCMTLAQQGQSVLDLGCGTGELAVRLAEKCYVTGVDPATAMLEIARGRQGCENVTWVEADARHVRLGMKFDLIILTGHSFQVFLKQADQLALLKTISLHLKPNGSFIFDSRNPRYSAPKSRTTDSNIQLLDHPEHGQIEMWNESDYDEVAGILTYKNGFRIIATQEEYCASAQILYTHQPLILKMLNEVGLQANNWYGDWLGGAFHENTKDIIAFGGVAKDVL